MIKKRLAIGLFSNLQGLEIGARRAGFYVPFSTDKEQHAKDAAPFLSDDLGIFMVRLVEQLYFDDIQKELANIKINIKPDDVDLLLGGPPCFGMTQLNAEYRSVFHHLNFLMFEMLRLAAEMQPKVVLIEQVPALLTYQMRPFFYLLIDAISRMGNYHWDYEVLNAKNFGCFQSRRRVIIMLVRKDLGVKPSFPTPNPVDMSKQSAYAAIGAELIRNTQFQSVGGKQRLINGRESLFPTMTSSKVEIFRDELWQELNLADRKILAHMEHFDMSDVLSPNQLTKMLGMMVIPPFAEALCKHVHNVVLAEPPERIILPSAA